ncbi:hypothetical protein [Rubritalea tangerina]|uniref:hypothetical protein n=1 Tax=Rubritalea tangerina TaxID=430798 RepID=UPI003616A38D
MACRLRSLAESHPVEPQASQDLPRKPVVQTMEHRLRLHHLSPTPKYGLRYRVSKDGPHLSAHRPASSILRS